jgi:hypothetical protein
MDDRTPKKLRSYCFWLALFGVTFIVVSLFGEVAHTSVSDTDIFLVYRFLGIVFGSLCCLTPYLLLKRIGWAKSALYILPIPFFLIGYVLEFFLFNIEVSVVNIVFSLVFIFVWWISSHSLFRTPSIERFFQFSSAD